MWKILITLTIGVFFGFLANHGFRPARWLLKVTPYIITGGLVFLLISMGAGLSSNPNVKDQIGQLGLQALILALTAMIGSISLVYLLQKAFFSQKKGREEV